MSYKFNGEDYYDRMLRKMENERKKNRNKSSTNKKKPIEGTTVNGYRYVKVYNGHTGTYVWEVTKA